MRIRKKLVILHTGFSLALAVILLLALRPAVRDLVRDTEEHEARLAMAMFAAAPEEVLARSFEGAVFRIGDGDALGFDPRVLEAATQRPGEVVITQDAAGWVAGVRWDRARGEFMAVSVRSDTARAAVWRLYTLLTTALLGVYFLIALTLEAFVLPRQVYAPIRRLLHADSAVQEGRRDEELIDEGLIPADELGEIMRSRNESIVKLRRQEKALAHALDQLEVVAMELKRKNHLLETAKRNLADQDRLASLGMMSAGIAHELNTPLAVLKGEVERIAHDPADAIDPQRAALMLRVVQRLERLSESLLDFARVRPPSREPAPVRALVEESWALVSIDRGLRDVELHNRVPESLEVRGDPDRLGQVFVNLLRNAADAMDGRGRIVVSAEETERDGRRWVSISVADSGPGIDPEVLPRLFEPFATTRLDDRGTGLGLAVSEGIIREHGGVILVRNAGPTTGTKPASDADQRTGAIFEIMLPAEGADRPTPAQEHDA
ncbi:MAG: sensor histidine kinase [Phycisphaerales bacterium]|nr:MAG: sensor histidine kinase [Phycisphaerales bacterium]